MSLNSLASSRNTSAVRIQEALSLLVPFHELPETEQMRIRHLKSQFPYDDQLIEHLKDVDLMQLVEYLAWIPFQNFVNVEHVGQGGFSTVMKGTIKSYKARSGYIHDAVFALKTIDKFMVGEAVLSTVITLRNSTQDFVSTIGLSRQKGSDNYLIDIINECWRIDPTKRPTASIISRRLFQAKVELDWFRRYNIPSFIIRSFLSSGKLSRKTKTHVEKRVADHQQDLDSDNSNFSLFTAPVSSVTLQELRKPKLISDTAKPFALGNVGWSGDGSSQ
ncbi:hypothetical protein BC938DRAFT_482060 [Jimgerdemannia flammicorona]|uniref:Protein kinase domain-containing protein n=1 Tax=Jimgerdemannia flammicorona TaxID=994334 RepID=A0A433QEX3_9FUNG|nr:hypothetical protein BC938DRAFT_482060 [Jimgerdemannia flammicorona]